MSALVFTAEREADDRRIGEPLRFHAATGRALLALVRLTGDALLAEGQSTLGRARVRVRGALHDHRRQLPLPGTGMDHRLAQENLERLDRWLAMAGRLGADHIRWG